MKNVLADLALESEASTALAIRLARAFDHPDDEHERLMARLLTPVAKFWICKRGSHFAQEAMECLGGNGYVEEGGEGVMARVYREMPLNSIWEGAGNIMALDLLRGPAQGRCSGGAGEGACACTWPARRARPPGRRTAGAHRGDGLRVEARRLAQDVALAVQASLLAQTAPPAVVGAFCASRLGGDWGNAFGTLGAGTDFDSIIQRAQPR
jgi:putative acyl-CoA dehydrogenase